MYNEAQLMVQLLVTIVKGGGLCTQTG